jgi:hypothetical protein
MSYLLLPLRNQGKQLLVTAPGGLSGPGPWVQFSIVGPRDGLLASEFVTAADIRRIARALLRHANAVEGKPNLRCLRGGKSRF